MRSTRGRIRGSGNGVIGAMVSKVNACDIRQSVTHERLGKPAAVALSMAIVAGTIGLAGCSNANVQATDYHPSQSAITKSIRDAEHEGKTFVQINYDEQYIIYVDVDNGVQYVQYATGDGYASDSMSSVMVNPDGKPIINKTWQKMHKNDRKGKASKQSADDANSSTQTTKDTSGNVDDAS